MSTQAPPASLILTSASFEKYFALTTTGKGNFPFPNTL